MDNNNIYVLLYIQVYMRNNLIIITSFVVV